MIDQEAEAALTQEVVVTAGAGVQNLFLGHRHLWMKGLLLFFLDLAMRQSGDCFHRFWIC